VRFRIVDYRFALNQVSVDICHVACFRKPANYTPYTNSREEPRDFSETLLTAPS
jgi:hypothetical protein